MVINPIYVTSLLFFLVEHWNTRNFQPLMHWSCRRKRYTFWSWSFLEWDWICMELLYLYIYDDIYIWLLYINRYTYVYSLYVYICKLYTIFWLKTMISITALFQCFFCWVVPTIEQADRSIESYLPLTMDHASAFFINKSRFTTVKKTPGSRENTYLS